LYEHDREQRPGRFLPLAFPLRDRNMGQESHPRGSGFKETTRLSVARDRLQGVVEPHGRSERVPFSAADGRVLAEPADAPRDVPHYRRAAMDGYAVRASDTFGASDRSPEVLERFDAGTEAIDAGQAARVHTGSAMPGDANAVVMIEQVEAYGPDLEVFDAVAEGENVGAIGEDVEAGQCLYDAGHRLRPSDLGLLKSVGVESVPVYERPTVGVIPTGEEVVQSDPDPGEVIETNATTVAALVRRWGVDPTHRDVVTDDAEALRAAIQRDLTKDVIVTTGGSSVGERDLVPEVVAELGKVLVHGVALKPGHPVALGVVEDTPVVMLPGYPVACIINAVQFLRPAVKWAGGMELDDPPTTEARLGRKIRSEPGVRTFARVRLSGAEGEPVAEPTRASGSGILSSVALADGWVQVPEEKEGIAEGTTVEVEDWEWLP
jgi:molybdopterin molybdotransferase